MPVNKAKGCDCGIRTDEYRGFLGFFFFYETRIQTLFTVFYCTFIEVLNVISKHHYSSKFNIVTERSGSNPLFSVKVKMSDGRATFYWRYTCEFHQNFGPLPMEAWSFIDDKNTQRNVKFCLIANY